MQGATALKRVGKRFDFVSIHAPNAGSDSKIWQKNKSARQIWVFHINSKFENL